MFRWKYTLVRVGSRLIFHGWTHDVWSMDDERVYRCWNAQNPGYEMLYAVKTSKKCDRYLIDVACILSAYLPPNCIARFWYMSSNF